MKNEEVHRLSLKAVVHPALTILSLFIYPHFIPNLHVFFWTNYCAAFQIHRQGYKLKL